MRMGSHVEYRDDATGDVRSVTLVYPGKADIAQGKVSVLTPLGAALIGLSSQLSRSRIRNAVRRSSLDHGAECEDAPARM